MIATFLAAFLVLVGDHLCHLVGDHHCHLVGDLLGRHVSEEENGELPKDRKHKTCKTNMLAPSTCNKEAEMWYAQVLPHSGLA